MQLPVWRIPEVAEAEAQAVLLVVTVVLVL
jgi:hypothetical protein